MNWIEGIRQPGVPAALGAALLFGAGTPLAKWLLDDVNPWLLAGLLYFGSGVGLTLYRRAIGAPAANLPKNDWPWFVGAIVVGGDGRPCSADGRTDTHVRIGRFAVAER